MRKENEEENEPKTYIDREKYQKYLPRATTFGSVHEAPPRQPT